VRAYLDCMSSEFSQGEKLWLVGREVTFVDYSLAKSERRIGPLIGRVVVQRPGERELCGVPLWLLARDEAESVLRANAIPIQLETWDID
jgi:hypothetical protein